MRMAIVSDIHGNRTAFEAVLADLKQTSPDVILHGGALADSGASPTEIVDRIRELGWEGVVGNTDEMLFAPESLQEFAKQSPGLRSVVAVVEEIAAATRESLGDARLAWLRELPRVQTHGPMTLVHASPESLWHALHRKRAMPTWSWRSDRSTRRSVSMVISIAPMFEIFREGSWRTPAA
jgi:Icc-related predicted phosphoesterase